MFVSNKLDEVHPRGINSSAGKFGNIKIKMRLTKQDHHPLKEKRNSRQGIAEL